MPTASAHAPRYVPKAITENTAYLLARLGSISTAAFREALEPMALGPRHYAVLTTLVDQGELATQHAVGGCLAIDPSTMVAVVDELEDQGLLTRRRDPADRRRYLLSLTTKGRRVHSACRSAADRCEAELLSALDDDQRATLRHLLQRALAACDA
ncbi:MAG: MarR family winged helix-turn-helix transcriptional regulator [Actinomycetota bacterium]|nr:MarR family winged helix-turn-helix transcriptional regulator [Actinomycetota bacterium]